MLLAAEKNINRALKILPYKGQWEHTADVSFYTTNIIYKLEIRCYSVDNIFRNKRNARPKAQLFAERKRHDNS